MQNTYMQKEFVKTYKTLVDDHALYFQSDTLLLTDIFEKF